MIADLKEMQLHLQLLMDELELVEIAQETLEQESLQGKSRVRAKLLLEHYLTVANDSHESLYWKLKAAVDNLEYQHFQARLKAGG